jgi:hypothetical protein
VKIKWYFMLEPIKRLNAIQVISETKTKGSSPLLVIAEDDQDYYIKTSLSQPPKMELINEVLCAYFLKCWNILSPDIALIKVENEALEAYKKERGSLSSRYKSTDFENEIFVGSKRIKPEVEFDKHFKELNKKKDFCLLKQPLDLIKIGVFDIWIANKDRKPENPNLLFSGSEKLNIHPIDHTAAWAHISHPKEIISARLTMEEKFKILNVPLIKSIAKFANPTLLKELHREIEENIQKTLENLDFIFEQVPKEWGFSKKGKQNIKSILFDRERNHQITKSYLPYLK